MTPCSRSDKLLIMKFSVFVVAALPVLVFASMLAYPETAISILAEVKRRIRLLYIRLHGKRRAETVFNELRRRAAKKGIDRKLVEDVIAEHREILIMKHGTRAANEALGEPSIWERYF